MAGLRVRCRCVETQIFKQLLTHLLMSRTCSISLGAVMAITGFAVQEAFYGTPVVEQTPFFFGVHG